MSIKRREVALKSLAMQMLEEGKILTKREYEMLRNRTEVRAGTLMNMFGSWSRMLTIMENSLPEVWAEIKEKENPKPKPVPPKVPKPAVKASVKPATAVKKDKDDE